MNASIANTASAPPESSDDSRLDYLDATRAFALVLGIVFHACLSFMSVFIGWAVQDISTSPLVAMFTTVTHSFRMETFFLLAGFFSHLTFHRKGVVEFVRTRLLRIAVPFVAGWFILRPLLVSGWFMGSASLRGDVDILAGLLGGFRSLSTLPAGIFTGSHLWFLYYLAMITGLAVVARGLLTANPSLRAGLVRRADAFVAWLANSPVSVAILVVPTAATLGFMGSWGMDTPDKSLQPQIPVLVVYGAFFTLGWILSRQRELIPRLARLTLQRWILAGAGAATILLLGEIERDPGHPRYGAAHVAYAVGYATTMWSLVLLTLGIFKKLCASPNVFIRYVADSSYWMYLIHLPLVVWLQVAVAELPLHWSIKLAFISAMTLGASLLTYDLLVRSTFIGWILSGRRRNRVMVPWILANVRQLGRRRRLRPVAEL